MTSRRYTTAFSFILRERGCSYCEMATELAAVEGISHSDSLPNDQGVNHVNVMLSGVIASAIGTLALHPIDTIKTTQQAAHRGHNMFVTATSLVRQSGFRALYRGVSPILCSESSGGAIKFATFETIKHYCESNVDSSYHALTSFLSAAAAMLASSIILVPGEILKIRLQAGKIPSITAGLADIYRSSGFRGYYVGYTATLVRDVPYTMLELGLYDNLKRLIRYVTKRPQLSHSEELSAAAVTGGLTGFLTTPFDVMKTRIMLQKKSANYGNLLGGIYHKEGIQAFFVGAPARVIWLVPFTTIYLGIYEVSKKVLATL